LSSRRRHTRSKRDWSSDVCSSDLAHATVTRNHEDGCALRILRLPDHLVIQGAGGSQTLDHLGDLMSVRLRSVDASLSLRDPRGEIGRASCRKRVESWADAELEYRG